MINQNIKFNVHSTYVKEVIMLKVADRRTDGWMDGQSNVPDADNRHPPKFWQRPKKSQ